MDINHYDDEVDLKLNLLSGSVLYTGDIGIKPLTIRQIADMKYSSYARNLSLLSLSKEDLTKGDPSAYGLSLIDIIIKSENELVINSFLDALCLFLNEDKDTVLISKMGFVFGGYDKSPEDCMVINSENYDDIIQIIKYQNCIVGSGEKYNKPNPADDKAQAILNKIKKGKEDISKKKESQGGNSIDFSDIVSAVSTKSNTYNKQNVWDLTVYQLYDEYKRLEAISGYDINIMAMMQGAKIDDLKHWSSKLE